MDLTDDIKRKLEDALEHCNGENKSEIYTIKYMQEYAHVTREVVLEYLEGDSNV